MAPRPNPTARSSTTNPIPIPSICGMEREKPKYTPDASSLRLFGPGVLAVTNAEPVSARKTPSHMATSIRSAILTYSMAGPHLYCHPNTEAWARAWRRPLFDRSFRRGAAFAVYCLPRGNDCHAEYRLALG